MSSDPQSGSLFADSYWRTSVALTFDLDPPVADTPTEAELRLLADNLPSLCWIAGADGAIGWYNRRWHDYCGTTPAAMHGWGWQSVHDPEVLPAVLERWTGCISAGEAFEMAFPLRGADGVYRPFLTRVTPLRDADGRVRRWFGNNTDVSVQRRTEAALVESEAYVRLLLNSSAEGFYAVDRDGFTTLCNASFLRMMGFATQADAIGRKLHDLIHHSHPGGSPYAVEACPIYRCARDGTPAHVTDELFYRLDGTPVPVEYWAKPLVVDGEHRGAICTFLDISDRRRAEAKLVASEAEFRTFAQAMPNQVWAADAAGMLDWVNEQVYDYGGFARGEPHGTGWAAMLHPEDVAGAVARWESAIARGERYETEFRLRRVDGDYRWHLARALPIRDAGDAITRWIGTNTDIQDQKSAAEALAMLNATLEEQVVERTAERDRVWRNSRDLLVITDVEGRFRQVSPSVTAILGWTPAEMIGRAVSDFVLPDDDDGGDPAPTTALDHVLDRSENRYRCKDGGCRWLSWVAAPEAGLVFATGRDVTAEKEAALAMARMQESLRQSQKMEAVGQLTGGIAHDFNNMLAVVIGSLDLLSRRIGGDDRSRRYVEAAAEGARRAASLTQRLLAFSRQQPLAPKVVDPNKLVAGMSDLLRHALGADVRLETVLTGGVWQTRVDPNQLENIVLNLAVNARDAMPDGGRLTIETQNAHLDTRYAAAHSGIPEGQYVLIAVTDTGAGMDKETMAKAFEPFFTTKAVGKGTGLGLSQVYGFVHQSGGHVKIYSELAQGTTIKIYLPRLSGPRQSDVDAPIRATAPLGEGQETILVVDDEEAVREVSVAALGVLGYRVIEADNAARALQLLDAHPEIAMLFTDVIMPDMNGRKLADAARARRPTLKILFTTGYTRNAVVHNGVLDEDVHLLGKPFTVEDLAAKVRAVLDER